MADQEQRKDINVSEYMAYYFVSEGKKKFATITCTTCAAVVKDAFAHALFHHLNNQYPHSGRRYQGKYSDGRLVIKLDHWGRRLE